MYVFDLMSRESLFKILCDIVQFLHANIKGFIQFDMFSLEVFSIFSGMKQGSVLAPPSIFAVIKINYEHQDCSLQSMHPQHTLFSSSEI